MTTADTKDIVTSRIFRQRTERGLSLSTEPHKRMSDKGRWTVPRVRHWSALSLPWAGFPRLWGTDVIQVGVRIVSRSAQISAMSAELRTWPCWVDVSAPVSRVSTWLRRYQRVRYSRKQTLDDSPNQGGHSHSPSWYNSSSLSENSEAVCRQKRATWGWHLAIFSQPWPGQMRMSSPLVPQAIFWASQSPFYQIRISLEEKHQGQAEWLHFLGRTWA